MEFKRLTIFTPTYNRAHLLPRLYASLVEQSCQEFTWLVVDDGSTDATEENLKAFKAKGEISMHYIKQVNQGKHIAINNGVELSQSELFFIVDSDDYLLPEAVTVVLQTHEAHGHLPKYAGLAGRRIYADGSFVEKPFDFESKFEYNLKLRYDYKIFGDLAEVYLTSILKEYPFPSIENERFIPEGIVWNRIAKNYKLYFLNQGIYVCEYIEGGLSSKILKIRAESPQLSMLYYSELAAHEWTPYLQKIRSTINFWRFSFYSSIPFVKKLQMVSFLRSLIAFPLAVMMFVKDKFQLKKLK